jgi:hypothetical protein
MSGRATKQAIAAAGLPEDSSDAVRIRHQLDAWANAAHRAPRLVATGGDEPGAGPSVKPPPAKKRSRPAAAARPKASRATKAAEAEMLEAKASDAKAADLTAADVPAPGAPAADIAVAGANQAIVAPMAPTEPERVPAVRAVGAPAAAVSERALASRAFALVAALALAGVAAYFSVAGMAEIFPGDPVAVMVLAGTMEAGKLVIAGWLAAHWRRTGWKMRTVLMTLVAGLALINAAGVFGKLVEAHVSVAATSRSGVTERIEALDARVKAQSAVVTDLDSRIAQIDRAVDESTRLGRVTRAINIATQQRVTRDGLDTQRQAATATLVGLQAQRAALAGERSRIEASTGPIQYLATMAGVAPEAAVRWLILLMVLCCDPAAIAMTVAAAGVRAGERK